MFQRIGSLLIVGALAYPCSGFAQIAVSGQERFVQPIIVNGQQTQGVLVVENGVIQTHTCSYPQQYVTADQSSNGWACFDSTTGEWLLRALPPATQTSYVYQQPPVYVSSPVIATYPYAYPAYDYYPYAYPYFAGPRFGFGVGFGFGYPVVRGPIVVSRARPVVIGRGGPIVARRGFVSSRPIGGFRTGGPGRASGRFSGRIGRR